MRDFLKSNKYGIGISLLFGIFVLFSFLLPLEEGIKAGENFAAFFIEMASFIPLIFILIGLIDVWFPRQIIERHIGKESGIRGIIWVIVLAMFQAGPLYGAFPVALMLWKKGSSIRNIFIYLGAFSVIKLPMISFETSFLGIQFSILRVLVSLPLFILIGYLMELILKKSGFQVREPSKPQRISDRRHRRR